MHIARNRETGFTLIELMVVVLIIALLLGIAIPTYLGFRSRAQDSAAKSDLVNGAKVEAIIGADGSGFTGDVAQLGLEEPSLDFSGAQPHSIHVVVGDAVDAGDNGQVLLYARSGSGTWFGIKLVQVGPDAGRYTCKGSEADVDDVTDCTGNSW